MLTRIGLGAMLAMVSAAGAGAQDAAPEGTGQTAGWKSVRAGDPVYVTDSRSQRRKGNIETVSDQDLTLKAGNRSWTVARADVQSASSGKIRCGTGWGTESPQRQHRWQ